MARTSNLDQAIETLGVAIRRKEGEIQPLRERLLILERAREVLTGEEPEGAETPFGRERGGRKPSNGVNPYAGFDVHKIKGMTTKQAIIEMARYAGGTLVTKYAGQLLIDAKISSQKVPFKANTTAYGTAAQAAEFKKSAPGCFTLTDKAMVAKT